jgi:hypothetical protein
MLERGSHLSSIWFNHNLFSTSRSRKLDFSCSTLARSIRIDSRARTSFVASPPFTRSDYLIGCIQRKREFVQGGGGYVLETVSSSISILSATELASTYSKISTLLLQAVDAPLPPKEDPTIPPTHALLDILLSFLPHSASVDKEFFDLAMSEKSLGNEKNQSGQKKACRLAVRLCEERGGNVVKGRGGQLVERIVEVGTRAVNGLKRVHPIISSFGTESELIRRSSRFS